MADLGKTRRVLTGIAGFAVAYAILAMGYVATSPDVGLRCLIEGVSSETQSGILIRSTIGLDPDRTVLGYQPRAGDQLVRLNGRPTPTFVEFTEGLESLRRRQIGKDGRLFEPETPLSVSAKLPPLVEIRSREAQSGNWLQDRRDPRWVRADIRPAGEAGTRVAWLKVQSIPLGELVPTYFWFLFQLAIILISAIAVWHRPFDRSAQLFLLMSALATIAFVGGFHWWVIASISWLNVPFIVAGMLLPAVTLHFFLVFPRPKPFLVRSPVATRIAVYVIPAAVALFTLGLLLVIRQTHNAAEGDTATLVARIDLLRRCVHVTLVVAGVYFAATLGAIWHGYVTTRNPIERKQVQWILGAALLATIPILYTVYLALFSRVEFATGRGRWPMFVASLSFMLAYAVGIVRYKLMLAYQYVTRSTLYYVVSSLLTIGLAIVVTACVLGAIGVPAAMTQQQVLAITAIVVLAIVLLVWVRDRIQGMADRHFFSERYRLDEAFQRMKPAAGHDADADVLGERLLRTCREVLNVEWAVLYLRSTSSTKTNVFHLAAARGIDEVAMSVEIDERDVAELQRAGTALRIRGESRNVIAGVQKLLNDLAGELVQAIEMDRHVGGLVVLGPKLSAAGFTGEDATFLHAVGQIASVGFHGSKVYLELTQLNEELRLKVDHAARQQRQIAMLQAELEAITAKPSATRDDGEFHRDAIKGNGLALQPVLETVRKVAATEATVLIRGESGTGKELLAQVVHDNSTRRDGPMVRVNCAALSPALLESELFGHVKGSFTGADRDRVGRFEMADGGTLFLDEIGDVPLDTQVKLLRVVQERCFERVGGDETIHVDVRLVTATHRDLEARIREGKFREDLYYRLNVVSVRLPALRERLDDLPELVFHFLHRASETMGKTVRHVDEAVWDALEVHAWPGNVRELLNVIERSIVLADGDTIAFEDLPAEIREAARQPRPARPTARPTVAAIAPQPIGSLERRPAVATAPLSDEDDEPARLAEALRRSDGNKARAARLLGLPRSTYYSKLKKHGIEG